MDVEIREGGSRKKCVRKWETGKPGKVEKVQSHRMEVGVIQLRAEDNERNCYMCRAKRSHAKDRNENDGNSLK